SGVHTESGCQTPSSGPPPRCMTWCWYHATIGVFPAMLSMCGCRMTDPTPWYVAHTKPRQERTAAEQLRRQDFEVYLPLFKVFCEPGRRRRASTAAAASAHVPGGPGPGAGSPADQGVPTLTAHEPMFP